MMQTLTIRHLPVWQELGVFMLAELLLIPLCEPAHLCFKVTTMFLTLFCSLGVTLLKRTYLNMFEQSLTKLKRRPSNCQFSFMPQVVEKPLS